MKYILLRKSNVALFLALLLVAVLVPVGIVSAAPVLPLGFEVETLVSGLNLPTDVVYSPDSDHIFIAEKSGVVRVAHDGALIPTPVITLPNVNTHTDRGLLSIALDPDFDTNSYLYLLYTHENTPDINFAGPKTARLIRVTLDFEHVAIPGSEVVLLGSVVGDVDNPSCTDFPANTDCIGSDGASHTIADLSFGPDGALYVSIGDASSFNEVDPLAHRALDIDILNGKVLRINKVDGAGFADNPYYSGDINDNRSKVWNLGLRNPFRISFRPANGSLYIGDVGWFTTEEVNIGVSGANFGWPCQEGFGQTPGYDCIEPGASDPLYAYAHDTDGAGSVTGGVFYTGAEYPGEYYDTYFFGDYMQNWIRRIVVDSNDNLISVEDFMTDADGPVGFNTDANGDIVYLSIYTGELRRITYTLGNRQPIAVASADKTSGLVPLRVQFSSVGSNDPDGDTLTYHWDFGDGDTTNRENPRHRYRTEGIYTVTLTVTDSKGAFDTDLLTIVAGNEAPTATILSPADGSFYEPDVPIQLLSEGIDPEDGVLGESAFTWQILLHHNIHPHILEELSGSSPTFLVHAHGDDDESIFVEAILTVTDSIGLTDTASVNLFESRKPDIILNGNSIMQISLGGVFTDPGATAFDEEDGDITALIVVGGDTVDTNTLGTYVITYNVTDSDGQIADEVDRTVIVSDSWLPIPPNGALYFDGIDDYVETGIWNVEDSDAFTLEIDFVADSFSGDTHVIAKSAGVLDEDYDWAFGISEVTETEGELFFKLKTGDDILTTLTGGTVVLGEYIRAAVVYNGSSMHIVKNGIEESSTLKSGLISNPGNTVWLGNVPTDFIVGGFHGFIDQIRVWNGALSLAEININLGLPEISGEVEGLIKNWKFNEGLGQIAIDSSNSGHHGTLGSTRAVDSNDPSYTGGQYSGGGTFIPMHTGTQAIPQELALGETTQIETTVENTGDGAGYTVVNIEIFDNLGNQVYQKFFDGEGFDPGEIRSFQTDFTPVAEGVYGVGIGLHKLFWTDTYEWVTGAVLFTVDEGLFNTPPVITLLGENPQYVTVSGAPEEKVFDLTGWNYSFSQEEIRVKVGDTVTINFESTGGFHDWVVDEFGAATERVSDGGTTTVTFVADQVGEFEYYCSVGAHRSLGMFGTLIVEPVYIDSGATAFDSEEGDLTSSIIIGGDLVDANTVGTYIVTYNAIDSEGLAAPEVTRTVQVVDTAFNPIHTDTTVSIDTSLTGDMVTITTTIINTGAAGNMLVDIEVYDEGVKTEQAIYNNEPFAEGEARQFILEFISPHAGEYGVAVGLFEPDWSGFYEWVSPAVIFTAQDGPPIPGAGINIYDDSIASGWASWSWDTEADFASTNVVPSQGIQSIEAVYTAPWGGLYLHHGGFDTTGTPNLVFEINGGVTGGQELQVIALDSVNTIIGQVLIGNYLSTIQVDTWDTVTIPLVDLSALDAVVTGFIIQGTTGANEPAFYLDNVRLE